MKNFMAVVVAFLGFVIFAKCRTTKSTNADLASYEDIVERKQCSDGTWMVLCKDGSIEKKVTDADLQLNRVCRSRESIRMWVTKRQGTYLASLGGNSPNCLLSFSGRGSNSEWGISLVVPPIVYSANDRQYVVQPSTSERAMNGCNINKGLVLKSDVVFGWYASLPTERRVVLREYLPKDPSVKLPWYVSLPPEYGCG